MDNLSVERYKPLRKKDLRANFRLKVLSKRAKEAPVMHSSVQSLPNWFHVTFSTSSMTQVGSSDGKRHSDPLHLPPNRMIGGFVPTAQKVRNLYKILTDAKSACVQGSFNLGLCRNKVLSVRERDTERVW